MGGGEKERERDRNAMETREARKRRGQGSDNRRPPRESRLLQSAIVAEQDSCVGSGPKTGWRY